MNDHDYMQMALDYAIENAVGDQGQVGAILVKDGQVVASGASNDDLGLHAEQVVTDSSDEAEGSTLFVTVQPSLYRTDDSIQSDSELITQAGITRVVVGAPNEKYSLQESQEFFAKHDVDFEV